MNASQAIITKFFGPTNNRGSRIKATMSSGWSITVPYSYELSSVECHAVAVKALIAKHDLKFGPEFVIGATVDSTGYIFTPIMAGYNTATLEG